MARTTLARFAALVLWTLLIFDTLRLGAVALPAIMRRDTIVRYDTEVYHSTSSKVFSLYHTNWAMYGRNYQVSDLPIDSLTDIAYAFVKLSQTAGGWGIESTDTYADFERNYDGWDSSNTLPFQGNLGQFYKLKRAGKKFNVILSLGGWTLSNNFSPAMATASGRTSLIQSIIDFFNKYPIFVGLSIDWEYLSNDGVNYGNGGNAATAADADNFVLFLSAFRAALNADNKAHYKIAFCSTAAPEKVKWSVPKVGALIDELHVMTYDFSSSSWGDTVTTHHANLYPSSTTRYSVTAAVDYYLQQGMPANKIMIGAAFYSRGFANTNGLGQPGSGVVSVMSFEQGVADYKSLPRAGFSEYWDDVAKATYAYNPATREFLSYDSVASASAKCDYVKQKGLLGIIAWESSNDFAVSNSRSLVGAIAAKFGSPNVAPVTTSGVPTSAAATSAAPAPTRTASVVVTSAATVAKTTITAAATTSAPVASPTAVPAGTPTWAANVKYQVSELVVYNGGVYRCLQSHVSLVGWEPDVQPALWTFVGSAPAASSTPTRTTMASSQPTTAAATSAPASVASSSKTVVTTTVRPTSTAAATPAATPTSVPGGAVWAPNTAYKVGDTVEYSGAYYRCLQAHTSLVGWEPNVQPALWTPVGGAPVTTAGAATTTVRPTTVRPTSASSTTTSSAAPTGTSVSDWSANTSYSVGQIVLYGGKTYNCLQAHRSLVGWEPSSVPALWKLV